MKKKQNDNEMADLFEKDLRKIKRAKYDDMDDTVTYDDKKNHSFMLFIFIFLMIIGLCYYYFVFDSSKTLFSFVANRTLNNLNVFNNDKCISYNLIINGKSDEVKINKIIDIINDMSFEGNIAIDDNKRILSGDIYYNDKKLINYNFLVDTKDKDNVYVKFDNISNRIIKTSTDNKIMSKYDTDLEDYDYILNKIVNEINDAIPKAKYTKRIVKDKNEFVKKISLKINNLFVSSITDELINDEKFISSYGKVFNKNEEDVVKILNKIKDEYRNRTDTLDMYLSILKNDFIKLEYNGNGNSLFIIKDNDKYNYEVKIDYTKRYDGYFKIDNTDKKNNLLINFNDLDNKLSLDIDLSYSLKDIDSVKVLDTEKAISYNDMDKEDLKEIINNLNNNDSLKELVKKFGIKDIITYIK